jgi:GNAT superfamily N-acetyltransferase
MDELRFPIDGYSLRAAGDDDMGFVRECMRDSILMSVPDNERELSGLWMEDILSLTSVAMDSGMMHSEIMILDDKGGKRTGMLWMGISRDQFTCEETGYLLGLFVIEGSRGKGLGKALIGCAEDWCRNKRILSMTLNVGSPNRSAKCLYDRLGFDERSTVMRKRIL